MAKELTTDCLLLRQHRRQIDGDMGVCTESTPLDLALAVQQVQRCAAQSIFRPPLGRRKRLGGGRARVVDQTFQSYWKAVKAAEVGPKPDEANPRIAPN